MTKHQNFICMYAKEEIQRIEQELDKLYDDRIGRVAQESGRSRPTVSKFFKAQKIRPSNAEEIYRTCISLIEQKINEHKFNARKMTRLSNELSKDR